MEMELNHRPINWLTSLVISKRLCKFLNCNCNYWHVNKLKSAAEKKPRKLFKRKIVFQQLQDRTQIWHTVSDGGTDQATLLLKCCCQLQVATECCCCCRPVLEAGWQAGSCQSVWRFWPNRVKTVENDKRHIANSWSLEQMQAFQLKLLRCQREMVDLCKEFINLKAL